MYKVKTTKLHKKINKVNLKFDNDNVRLEPNYDEYDYMNYQYTDQNLKDEGIVYFIIIIHYIAISANMDTIESN